MELTSLRAHLTYANLMATIAVFIALGGAAWAAATINSKDVVNDSLKSVDLKNGQGVQDPDVVPDSLTGGAIDESSLNGSVLQFRGATTACGAGANITAIGADGNVTCAADGAGGAAGGVLSGSYPDPGFQAGVNELVPVTAFVVLGSTGAVGSETHRAPMSGVPVVTRNGAGDYTVDLPGLVFISSVDVANCTVQDNAPFSLAVSSVNGQDLAIRTFNGAGTAADPARLHCTVYNLA